MGFEYRFKFADEHWYPTNIHRVIDRVRALPHLKTEVSPTEFWLKDDRIANTWPYDLRRVAEVGVDLFDDLKDIRLMVSSIIEPCEHEIEPLPQGCLDGLRRLSLREHLHERSRIFSPDRASKLKQLRRRMFILHDLFNTDLGRRPLIEKLLLQPEHDFTPG